MSSLHLMVKALDGTAFYLSFDSIKFVTVNKFSQTVIFSDEIGLVTTKAPIESIVGTVWG